jgi:hypothetical protein
MESIDQIFFDYFGFIIWIFLVWIAITDLKNKKLARWPRIILFIIGIIGIALDGILLILNYIGSYLVQYAWLFDHLGIFVFTYILALSVYDLKNRINLNRGLWSIWVLIIISILGLLADGFILYSYYSG